MGVIFLVTYNKFLSHNERKGNKFGIKPLKEIFVLPRITKRQIISETSEGVVCKEAVIKGQFVITQP